MLWKKNSRIATLFMFASSMLLSGCAEQSLPSATAPTQAAPPTAGLTDEEHGHQPGEHGGIIVSIGRNSYHAEAVFEDSGVLKLYTLGQDETRVIDVESQTLTAYVKAEGEPKATSMVLAPEPQPGDTAGKTSQFMGRLPEQLEEKSLEVTIPSIRINGERFRIGFVSATSSHDEEMPSKVAEDEEHDLYLVAGGAYTEADIKANGSVTVSQKFKGFKAKHDLKPKAGDQLCPVTLTKANAECSWIIGGKTYEFCCPPCVDEFVKLAKEDPDALKQPEEYVKR